MTEPSGNPGFGALQPYPFEHLAALLADATAPSGLPPIRLSIGEPRHAPPPAVLAALHAGLDDSVTRYPTIAGGEPLRAACAAWLQRRFSVRVDPATGLFPLCGTREGLFAIAQALIAPNTGALVAMPNPFYQIYEGAALLAGAEPLYLAADPGHHHLPDLGRLSADELQRLKLVYLCSPVNPAGSVAPLEYLVELLQLAARHNFVVVADECYIEIYRDTPPVSLLEAAIAAGHDRFEHALVFHSLSKRSNLPGLRSGFVAGDARLVEQFGRYRTYHGCSMPLAVQAASAVAWSDDTHVEINRSAYNEKFNLADALLGEALRISIPPATFYLWPDVGTDDTAFCRALFEATHVTAVPGSYFGRSVDGDNPGAGRVRLSLVAGLGETREALTRLAEFCASRPT